MPLTDARGLARTRAGLGSGLEIAIPTGSWVKPAIWMNVPVVEPFARRSPYGLEGSREAGYRVWDSRTFDCYPIEIPDEPAWYSRNTTSGEYTPMGMSGNAGLNAALRPKASVTSASR